ncbi:phosphatidylinositol-specific phospholipase C1-like protein [Aquihabitans daechungensis]|uniref:phosphatidylinositol-specific phospholipase C1-like protein n=1 Tax=Aquihabitans daechungensis TaxID=1052257 RepID=UPI003BA20248
MAHGTFGKRALLGATALVVAALAGCSGSSDGGASGSTQGGPEPAGEATTTTVAPDDDLKLNQIQVIGTHNSFHVEAPEDELAQVAAFDEEQAAQRRYTHPDLTTQLDEQQIRQLELDVFADSKGGLYSDPALAGRDAKHDPAMDEPGTKVMHEQDVDYHSVCPTLVACLTEVEEWSDANPSHVPIAINIQFKDGPLIFPVEGQAVPEKWTTAAMDGLDEEIRSVFDEDQLITPDDVRGDRTTLNEAVLAKDWPTLGESRGKVMFLMINPEPYRSIYLDGHEGLEGRILFTNAEPGQPDASYIGLDDPLADTERIMDLVDQGYLVRTRADANNVEVQAEDVSRLDAALKSGAQWISTDYPGPDGAKALDRAYVAELPGFRATRCNPISAPTNCVDAAVEP